MGSEEAVELAVLLENFVHVRISDSHVQFRRLSDEEKIALQTQDGFVMSATFLATDAPRINALSDDLGTALQTGSVRASSSVEEVPRTFVQLLQNQPKSLRANIIFSDVTIEQALTELKEPLTAAIEARGRIADIPSVPTPG
ncbi:MAG: hypothetical protein J0L97_06915 [Alphaproteobacteria bacterium]|nr:hypothetical protein [Alphaproteobacteria bacterium]